MINELKIFKLSTVATVFIACLYLLSNFFYEYFILISILFFIYLFNSKNIRNLNKYDYLIVGGGGLILPDTAPNKLSGWQWNISIENLNLIKKPIYVISIGFNLFYGQNMSMTDRNSNKIDSSITPIFKESIKTLIKKSFYFYF